MRETTLAELVARDHVTARARFVGETTDQDGWQHRAWRVTLRRDGRQLTTSYRTGMGITGEPTAADVLGSMVADVSALPAEFAEWCHEFGFNPDSRRAESTYRECVRTLPRLARFLGDSLPEYRSAEW